jgi:transposase
MYFRDNLSLHEIARKTNLSRPTVRKWIKCPSSTEIKYHRIPAEKITTPFEQSLVQQLEANVQLRKCERWTVRMLFDEITKQGFTGSYSNVTRFACKWREQNSKACESVKPTTNEEMQRWMHWLYTLAQPHRLPSASESTAKLNRIYEILNPSPNSPRAKAIVVLAKLEGFAVSQIATHLAISRATVRRYLADFQSGGEPELFMEKSRPRKSQDINLQKCIFSLLHEPPTLHGYNRTTWRMDDLKKALNKYGHSACNKVIHEVIKNAGYRWKSAKVVLTSNDPDYREKYHHIQDILSALKSDERFFSIDEYGPFAIKMKAGRMLVESDAQPTVPQWQKSKGWLILTAALELSRNQVTHFYSRVKNTGEMIRMTEALIQQYADASKLYISWDAASWHISKELKNYIKGHNDNAEVNKLPIVELAPLPASAQFLNVIESVFSGMARAIIHSSDYESTKAAMNAIDRYFKERNQHFIDNPKRAGNKIWGMERTSSEFSASNNCKDPAYR